MFYKEDRAVIRIAYLANRLRKLLSFHIVESRSRLIQNDKLGSAHKCARHFNFFSDTVGLSAR